jgi:zinc-ribbon domain
MELASIFLLLAFLALVAFYVTRPFVIRTRSTRGDDPALSALLAERDRILTAIQELDFDYTLGKIPADEYPAQREMLVQNGAAILRQLDERPGANKKPTAKPVPERSTSSDDEIEDLIASRRAIRKEKTGGFCPKCGKPVLLSDRFCPKCGHSLK